MGNASPRQELHLLLLRDKFKTRLGQSPVSTQLHLSQQEALQRAQTCFCTKSGQEAHASTWCEASNTSINIEGLWRVAETVDFVTPLAPRQTDADATAEQLDPALPRAGDAEIRRYRSCPASLVIRYIQPQLLQSLFKEEGWLADEV